MAKLEDRYLLASMEFRSPTRYARCRACDKKMSSKDEGFVIGSLPRIDTCWFHVRCFYKLLKLAEEEDEDGKE